MRGRKPRPTHLKLVMGNPGKRAINRREPKPAGDLDAPPAWLTPAQKTGWRAAIEAAPPGLLKRCDRGVLTAFVVANDLAQQARQLIGEGELVITTPSGRQVPHPALTILSTQSAIVLRCAAEMGFTPASRSRVSIVPDAMPDEFFD